MPIYEYLCESCGKVNERLQKVSDPPPSRCDECGARKLAKLVSRSAFQLKGGGWYSDLYASKKKEAPAAEGGATPAAEKGAEKGGDKGAEKGGAEAAAKPADKKESPAPAKPAASPDAAGKGARKDRKKGGR